MTNKPTTIVEYLATLTRDQREGVEELRRIISAAAPQAEPAFSYRMPAFNIDGRPLLWFAAWKKHYSLYPVSAAALESCGADMEVCEHSQGTVKFPASAPLPHDLIRRIVNARITELGAAPK